MRVSPVRISYIVLILQEEKRKAREAKAKALAEAGEGAGVEDKVVATGGVASKPLKAAPKVVGTKGSFQVGNLSAIPDLPQLPTSPHSARRLPSCSIHDVPLLLDSADIESTWNAASPIHDL